MKTLYIFLLILFTSGLIFSQSGEGEVYPDNELTIQVTNTPNKIISFELTPVGTVFCRNSLNCNFNVYSTASYISTLETDDTGDILCGQNGFETRYCDEGNQTELWNCADAGAGLKPLRWGFYKMTIKENDVMKGYCYFDWREYGFPRTSCDNRCTGNDMTIRYDSNDGLVFFNLPNPDKNNPNGYIVSDGTIFTWADWKCTTRNFTPFWSNGLVLAPDASNHPRIAWGPHGDINGTTLTYYIYKATNYSVTPPSLSSFNLVATVSGNTYEYIDEDFTIGGNFFFHYYVKARYIPTKGGIESFSTPTNIVSTPGSLSYKIKSNHRKTLKGFISI